MFSIVLLSSVVLELCKPLSNVVHSLQMENKLTLEDFSHW